MWVLGQAGVVSSMGSEDFVDSELWFGVNLRVVVKPDVLTAWIGWGLTVHGNSLILQSGVSMRDYVVWSYIYLRFIWTN